MSSVSVASQERSEVAREPGSDQAVDALPISRFIWGAGIECSFLPHMNVDQFQWTQHNRAWRDDFRLAKNELGISHLRYAFPWHVLESQRGKLEWGYADERVQEARDLGLDL